MACASEEFTTGGVGDSASNTAVNNTSVSTSSISWIEEVDGRFPDRKADFSTLIGRSASAILVATVGNNKGSTFGGCLSVSLTGKLGGPRPSGKFGFSPLAGGFRL